MTRSLSISYALLDEDFDDDATVSWIASEIRDHGRIIGGGEGENSHHWFEPPAEISNLPEITEAERRLRSEARAKRKADRERRVSQEAALREAREQEEQRQAALRAQSEAQTSAFWDNFECDLRERYLSRLQYLRDGYAIIA